MRLSAAEARFAVQATRCLLIRAGRLASLPCFLPGAEHWVAEPQEIYRMSSNSAEAAMQVRYLADGSVSPWLGVPSSRWRAGQKVPFGGVVKTARMGFKVNNAWELRGGKEAELLDAQTLSMVAPGPVCDSTAGHRHHRARIERLLADGDCTIIDVMQEFLHV